MSSTRGVSNPGSRGRIIPAALGAGSLALFAVIATWPGGVTGFMHGVAEDLDVVAIAVLASLIGILFVLFHRLGLSIGYVDEIDAVTT